MFLAGRLRLRQSGQGRSVHPSASGTSAEAEAGTDAGGENAEEVSEIIASAQADTNFNAEGYPLVKETVKKTIMIKKPGNIGDIEEMETLNYIAEKMNIEIEWIVVGADGWNERVNLMLATNDLPDINMKGTIPNLSTAIEDGTADCHRRPHGSLFHRSEAASGRISDVAVSARASDGKPVYASRYPIRFVPI